MQNILKNTPCILPNVTNNPLSYYTLYTSDDIFTRKTLGATKWTSFGLRKS